MSVRQRTPASCRKVMLDLSRALEGELPVRRCAAIERHLATCADCAKASSVLRAAIAACRRATAGPLPRSIKSRARQRIKSLLER